MSPPTLEQVIVGEQFFNLSSATPVQVAITRAADGRALGELASHPRVIRAFGGATAVAALPVGQLPDRVDGYSGIRTFKSGLAAGAAYCMSQRVDVSMVRPGEMPRIPIVSLDRDKADAVFGHLVGTMLARPLLRGLLVGEPTKESIVIRHPSGINIEVCPVAGKRAGGALVARWLAGVIFDEAPRMLGSIDGAVVNIDDALDASAGRILPGGQTWVIGSPWAPWGECFESVKAYWGKPSRSRIVVKAPAYDMNPVWWTPERVAHLAETNPRAHRTDVESEFVAPATSPLDPMWVDHALRPVPRYLPTSAPIGVLDSSAGRGDSFVWAVAQWCQTDPDVEYEGESAVIEGGFTVFVHRGGVPLKKPNQPQPEAFLLVHGWGALDGKVRETTKWDPLIERIAQHWRRLGAVRGVGDQYQSWPIESGMQTHGIQYTAQTWDQTKKIEALGVAKNWFRDGRIIIDAGPLAESVRTELVQLQVKPTTSGGETIGARHGGRDDRVALILNLAMLDSLGEFRGSPLEQHIGMVIDSPVYGRRYIGGAHP